MKLWLIGMMGAGKTTVGRAVAARLDATFGDMDAELAARHGPIEEQFHDEPAFRRREQALVHEWARSDDPLVIASGGGSIMVAESRKAMRSSGLVVWLRAPVPTLAGRAEGSTRPLLQGAATLEILRGLAHERERFYEDAADVLVDADRSLGDVVDEVVRAWTA